MKRSIVVLMTTVALAVGARALWACPHSAKGKGCPLMDKKAEYSLADKGDHLEINVVLHGCEGLKTSLLDRLQGEFGKAERGECHEACPFCVKGLKYELERTPLGAVLKVTGAREALDEFKARFEKKMEMRKVHAEGSGCGCQHGKQ